nr:immunoglobulin heavy chain junction region [Mus musculus]
CARRDGKEGYVMDYW